MWMRLQPRNPGARNIGDDSILPACTEDEWQRLAALALANIRLRIWCAAVRLFSCIIGELGTRLIA
jgi:hypothetical protein